MQKNRQQTTKYLSDDLKFLIACCQTERSNIGTEFLALNADTPISKEQEGCILDHISKNEDEYLQNLISLSIRHGILPLVYKAIKEISAQDNTAIPHNFLNDLKAHYMSISQRNMLMSGELIRIMKLLRENHIEALAFKGPALSQMAYGDITLRQYVDLDVLTRKKDIYKIDALLKAQGYERLLSITPTQEKVYIQYAHDLGLIHKQKGVHFEMHWSFLDEDYPMQVDLEDFWKETQEVKLNSYPVSTFSNENLIVYLSIHGSKHLWERIEWIKDIDLLIRKNDIDWEKVIDKTNGTGFEKMVYLGLFLNASLFNTPLPDLIQKEIAKYPQMEQLSTFIFKSWATPKSTFQKTTAMLKLFPGIKEKTIYLHKVILKPSFNEYWYVDLPKGFYWGYYLVRPYLLLKKYLSKSD